MRKRDLWATHLGPELGGQGYGQLKLALLNEILGRSPGRRSCSVAKRPDTGNAEIIAHYGTPEQKERYLRPLLDGEIFSCYSMTEPHAGADPTMFTTRAERDGDEWVHQRLEVLLVERPDRVVPHRHGGDEPRDQRVPRHVDVPRSTDTPGVNIVRNVGLAGEPEGEGSHALIHYENVRVPADALLGGEGPGVRHRPDAASAAAGSTTPCARSAWRTRRST